MGDGRRGKRAESILMTPCMEGVLGSILVWLDVVV
jgi:hypothetical protein